MKILHSADWHARDLDIDEVKKCLWFLVDQAKDIHPNLIVIAGDVFDSQNVKLDSKAAKLVFNVISDLADICPVAVVLGTPSHDGEAAEVLNHIKARHNVWVSTRPEKIFLWKDKSLGPADKGNGYPVLNISMVPQPTKQFFETGAGGIKENDAAIAEAMNAIFAGFGATVDEFQCPHILVGHWNTSGAYISDTQVLTGMDIEIHPDQLALAKADIVLLGHIHKAQKIDSNIFYAGSIYRKTWGEMDDKGFYIHGFGASESNFESKFIQVPTRKLVKLEDDFTKRSIDEKDTVLYGLERTEIDGAHIRVEFKVWQDEANQIEKDKVVRFYESAGAADVDVRIIRVPRENVRSKNILKLQTLREKLIEQAALRDETVPESILEKADLLESMQPETILNMVAAG